MRKALLSLLLAPVLLAQVRPEDLVRARQTPDNWLTYSGSYDSQRYSALEPDHAGKCKEPSNAMGVPGEIAREIRVNSACGRWPDVPHTGAKRRAGVGCGYRPGLLALLL